jgi:hypothetical protein
VQGTIVATCESKQDARHDNNKARHIKVQQQARRKNKQGENNKATKTKNKNKANKKYINKKTMLRK